MVYVYKAINDLMEENQRLAIIYDFKFMFGFVGFLNQTWLVSLN